MSTEDKEYVSLYVSKKIAKQFKDLKENEYDNIVIKYMEGVKADMKDSIESIDEDVLIFKGMMAKAKQAFKGAKNEYLESSYKIWEDVENDLPSISKKTKRVIDRLLPLKEELKDLNEILKSLQTYDMEKLIDFIKFFNQNVYGETENILKFLMKNYKTK